MSLYMNVFSNTCKPRCGVPLSIGSLWGRCGGCTSGLMVSASHEHAWFSGNGAFVSNRAVLQKCLGNVSISFRDDT